MTADALKILPIAIVESKRNEAAERKRLFTLELVKAIAESMYINPVYYFGTDGAPKEMKSIAIVDNAKALADEFEKAGLLV